MNCFAHSNKQAIGCIYNRSIHNPINFCKDCYEKVKDEYKLFVGLPKNCTIYFDGTWNDDWKCLEQTDGKFQVWKYDGCNVVEKCLHDDYVRIVESVPMCCDLK